MARRRCKEVTNKGSRCTYRPQKNGICKMHNRVRKGMGRVLEKDPEPTWTTVIHEPSTNGKGYTDTHSLADLLKRDVNWLVKNGTDEDFDKIVTLREFVATL